jgi:cytochrome c oxidase subunit II
MWVRTSSIAICMAALSGCAGNHSAFSIGGPRAQQIAHLMLIFIGVSAVVYLIVIGLLIWSLLRRRSATTTYSEEKAAPAEGRARIAVGAGIAVTVVVLLALAIADFTVQRSLSGRPDKALRILIIGHQYWWEIEYDDPAPANRIRTANEFRIPINRPVELILTSRDVIHSFWLPSLSGKKDLIPGHLNTELVIAQKPGTYTGQCAEFCGLQHAQMRLSVTAVSAQEFESWKQHELSPAREPATDTERAGRAVFERSSCILCHTIEGTAASATVGPDLTHLADRGTMAAGTVQNNPANLSSWILAPQRIKPGAQMPATPLRPTDLTALTRYLASLQ